jgi:hypothetical protein
MTYKPGTKITCRTSGNDYIITESNEAFTYYQNHSHRAQCATSLLAGEFVIHGAAVSALDKQEGGDHYKKLGDYQPWEVLRAWLTPEEFRGYMKGTAIAYLARERSKGGMLDIKKATHTLQGLTELSEAE